MANPLSPLSSSAENARSVQSTVRHEYIATALENTHIEETVEHFYEVDEYIPSSPPVCNTDSTRPKPISRTQSPVKSPSFLKMLTGWNASTTASPRPTQTPEGSTASWQDDENKENQGEKGLGASKSSTFDPDDTCASAFSMVPTADMTRLARLDEANPRRTPPRSPTKTPGSATLASRRPRTPVTVTRPPADASPTPRRRGPPAEDSTTQLLEFTEQLAFRGTRSSPPKAAQGPGSPLKHASAANLLDFDLPPAPTPRSIPSISAREVETLKANFLSQISSLKATIDGKDATIRSLSEAKDDAERRVGEVSESLREVTDVKKNLLEEKADWEKRDHEIKTILRDVKSELVHRERERDELSARLEESEKHREESETSIREADAKITGLQKELQQAALADPAGESKTPHKAVEVAVEKVARELHQLYKQKHEAKVSALKKSYEARWEKKVRELESRLADMSRENEDLKNGRETTMTKVVPGMMPRAEVQDAATSPRRDAANNEGNDNPSPGSAEQEQERAANTAQISTLTTRIEALEREISTSQSESQHLRAELELSRAENSDLVAVVEEMLQLDPSAAAGASTAGAESCGPASTSRSSSRTRSGSLHARSGSQSDQFRISGSEHAGIARPPSRSGIAAPKSSGLARPGFGFGAPSGSGRMPGGLTRPGTSGGVAKSGIMSSIERMGRGRTGDVQ